jgi:hypothetical protein
MFFFKSNTTIENLKYVILTFQELGKWKVIIIESLNSFFGTIEFNITDMHIGLLCLVSSLSILLSK